MLDDGKPADKIIRNLLLSKDEADGLLARAATHLEACRDTDRDGLGLPRDDIAMSSQKLSAVLFAEICLGSEEPTFEEIRRVSRQLFESSKYARVNEYLYRELKGQIPLNDLETHMRVISSLAERCQKSPQKVLELVMTSLEDAPRLNLEPELALQSTEGALAWEALTR